MSESNKAQKVFPESKSSGIAKEMSIPPFKYYFPQSSIDWITSKIKELLESGDFLALGKYGSEFEKLYAQYIGTKYALCVNSGTSAVEVALRSLDVKGFEVIVPTNTFVATVYAIIGAGAKPVFVDIDNDLNFSLDAVKNKINSKTKAIVPVHIGGLVPTRMNKLVELAKSKNLYVVEDAAHAHGSTLNDVKAGALGTAAGFSFFSTKVMTTGEGGMLTTSNEEIMQKGQMIRDQGKLKGNLAGVRGYNWRMTEFQAIVGLAQLKLLEEIVEKRIKIARIYDDILEGFSVLEIIKPPAKSRSNYYKYSALIPKGRNPEELRLHLKSKYKVSLGGYVYEVPLHKQPIFAEYVTNQSEFPVADDLCTRHIALPMYPQMSVEEAHYVADSVKSSIKELGWSK
jgi:perosamine synthetase